MKVIAKFLLENIGQYLWGFKPQLMSHFVEQYGSVSSVIWFARKMPKYERILKKRGPIRTHTISITVSLINGCQYCAFGHAHAFQLHYLKYTDTLFPLSNDALLELTSLPGDQAIPMYCSALIGAGLQDEVPIVRKTFELLNSASDSERQNTSDTLDNDISHLIGMFSTLNACGIKGDVEPDEAHDPINKDKDLIARYIKLRAESGKELAA